MRKFSICFIVTLAASLAFGQGVFVPPQVALNTVNGITRPIAQATITVCAAGASGIPCSPVLVGAIFKDAALTQPLSNPFTTDTYGNYNFAAAALTTFTVTVTAPGYAGFSYQITTGGGSGSSGITGCGGTPNFLAIWTGSTVLCNSLLSDDGTNLIYAGTNLAVKNINNNLIAVGQNLIMKGADGSGATHGGAGELLAGSGTGTNSGGGQLIMQAGSGTGSAAGGAVTLQAGSTITGNGGSVVIQAGASISGPGLAGNVLLEPGFSSTTYGGEGTVSIGITSGYEGAMPFYLGVVTFANLFTPPSDPVNFSTHGALLNCTDCKGPQDSVSWGSTAVGSGTGAVLKYTGSAWIVIG